MRLFLMQHGDALDKKEDPQRPLSPKGKEDVAKMAAFLSLKRIRFDEIWHSGKTRSQETAMIIWQEVCPGAILVEENALDPDTEPKPVLKRIEEKSRSLFIVGHLPQLSRLTGLVLCGNEKHRPVGFQKGCIVMLENEENHWYVKWMVTPDLL